MHCVASGSASHISHISSPSFTKSSSTRTFRPSALILSFLSFLLTSPGVTGVIGVNGIYGLYGVCGTPVRGVLAVSGPLFIGFLSRNVVLMGPGESGFDGANEISDVDAFWKARSGRVFVDEDADFVADGLAGSDASCRFEGRR
jgi:hypothetical protein